MKIFYTSILIFCGILSFAQNIEKIDFSEIDRSEMKTDLLLTQTKAFSVLTNREKTHFSAFNFSQSYQELALSDKLNRFPETKQIQNKLRSAISDDIISVGIIHTKFETISQKAFDNNFVVLEGNKLKKITDQTIFETHQKTIIAPLTVRKKGLKTTFKLDSNFVVNTTSNPILSVKADFDDGKGFQTFVDQDITIVYSDKGTKTITFEVEFQDGTTTQNTSSIEILYSNEDLYQIFNINVETINSQYTPDLGMYGESNSSPGVCEYNVFLGSDNALDKPIIIVDGFDPGDTRDIQDIYNSFTYTDENNQQINLADQIREEGYDIIIVNFPVYAASGDTIDGGADYIERNALSLATVINTINSEKIGEIQNVVIGPSMGGLISRYALRYMETNNIDHDTRLWISFDSPHSGANIPIALQHTLAYFAYGTPNVEALGLLIDNMLRSPAAKQMLVDHLDAHFDGTFPSNIPSNGVLEPAGAPNYRDNFQNMINTLGFPQNTRNVVVTNGSGNGTIFNDKNGNPATPNSKIMDGTINLGQVNGINTRLVTDIRFMPAANVTSDISQLKIQAQIFVWLDIETFKATAKQHANSEGVDTAPGGLFDISDLTEMGGDIDPVIDNFLDLLKVDRFNFIPTVSAMALYNQPNYYHIIDLGAGSEPWTGTTTTNPQTPFVNWYMPNENQTHVAITQENAGFIWNEIFDPTLKTDKKEIFSNLVVYPNPNNGIVNISGITLENNTKVTLIDISGRILQEKNYSQAEKIELDLRSLQQGTYFIVLETENQKIARKIIKQ